MHFPHGAMEGTELLDCHSQDLLWRPARANESSWRWQSHNGVLTLQAYCLLLIAYSGKKTPKQKRLFGTTSQNILRVPRDCVLNQALVQ